MTAWAYRDLERVTVDYLTAHLAWTTPRTIGVGLPDTWTPSSAPHVQVAVDGDRVVHPVAAWHVVRCTVWADRPTLAKALASAVQACLLAHPGSVDVVSYSPHTGLISARDRDHGADLASFTVRSTSRPVPAPTGA